MRASVSAAVEQLEWVVAIKVKEVKRPPYLPDMRFTPLSVYRDNVVLFPPDATTAGSKRKAVVNLLGAGRFKARKVAGLRKDIDAALLEALKQAAVCYIFTREILPLRRKKLSAVATIHREVISVRRLLLAFREVGVSCLSSVTPSRLREALTFAAGGNSSDYHFEVFLDLIEMSRNGMLLPALPDYDWEHEVDDSPKDLTAAKGKQALSESETEALLRPALEIFEHRSAIIDAIRDIRQHEVSPIDVKASISQIIPVLQEIEPRHILDSLVVLIMIACTTLIGFHLGLRPSELLSLRRNFISSRSGSPALDEEKITLKFTRSKGVPRPVVRTIRVHPFLKLVADTLEDILDATGETSDHIFPSPSKHEEMSLADLSNRMRKFCRLIKAPAKVTGYSWRKTVIDLLVRLMTDGLTIAAVIMDHIDKNETAGYALSSPHLADDLQTGVRKVWSNRLAAIFEQATGPETLGGAAGIRFQQFLAEHTTATDLQMSQEEFVADAMSQHIYPIKVGPGKFCVKPPCARGSCSLISRDVLADSANCKAGCEHHLQMPERKKIVEENINNLKKFLNCKENSQMQKIYAVNQLCDQIEAWPDLRGLLESVIASDPSIRNWFDDA